MLQTKQIDSGEEQKKMIHGPYDVWFSVWTPFGISWPAQLSVRWYENIPIAAMVIAFALLDAYLLNKARFAYVQSASIFALIQIALFFLHLLMLFSNMTDNPEIKPLSVADMAIMGGYPFYLPISYLFWICFALLAPWRLYLTWPVKKKKNA